MKKSNIKNNKDSKKTKNSKVPITIGITLGVIISFFDIKYNILDFIRDLSFKEILLLIIVLCISFFLVIVIHELGHLTFGKIKGFKFSSFRVGPFSIDKNNDKLKFSLLNPKGYGGLSVMYPKENSNLNDFLFYLFGGIVFNLLSGIVFLFIYYFNLFSYQTNLIFIILAVMSFILAIQNLIPFYNGNNPSDGKMIFSIIKKDELSKKFYKNFIFSNQLISGTRPRDIESNIEFSLRIEESLDLNLLLLEYFISLDKDDKEKIEKYIEKIEENINYIQTYQIPSFYYELIYNYSIKKNSEKVDYYIKELNNINCSLSKDEDINGKRVNAYYNYFILDDEEKSFKLAKEGLEAFDNFPLKGQAKMEKTLIEKLFMLKN